DMDIVVGDEDGRVALIEHTGKTDADGVPLFLPPQFFQQEAGDLKFGALITPVSVDWDGDGDEDLLCGNTSGNIAFIENLDGGDPPKWARPILLEAARVTIHFQAGPKGSIQGPCEAKWGYTTFSVADWNHDGLLDLIVNSIWGKVVWFENTGTKTNPRLAAARPVEVEWEGMPPKPAWNWWDPESKELTTQWRTTPVAVDWNEDGLTDLVMLDHEGYLALFQRERRDGGRIVLLPGRRVFSGGVYDRDGKQIGGSTDPLRLNNGIAGKSGRRKLCIVDWDGDGRRDLLINSRNTDLHRNVGESGGVTAFEEARPLARRRLAGHTTSPTTVDWDRDGVRDLLIGAEDGRFYFMKNDSPVRSH
ncbi:MAG: VCBS repeat-containing protein, partial [Verrucomicrobia bacterium]